MQQPTVHMPGCGFGDAFGLGWFLGKIGDTWLVNHGGSTNGQEASLSLLPEHGWALALLTNASPGGMALNEVAVKRVLAACTGLVQAAAEPVTVAAAELAAYEGEYRARGMHCRMSVGDSGNLLLTLYDDQELLPLMFEEAPPASPEPTTLEANLVKGHADRYVLSAGPVQGVTGYFERGADDRVQALHLFGRRLPRK